MSIGAACAERNFTEAHVSRFGSSIYSPTNVDDAIHEAQRCIVEALDLDGSTLFERCDDGDLLGTHGWWRPEVPAPPARVSARESFPWMLARLMAGELVSFSSPDELPDGVDRATLRRFDVKSLVVVPLPVAQRIVGVVCFGVTRGERQWPPEILQRLRLAAGMFANALGRRQSDEPSRLPLAEVRRFSDHPRADNMHLRREVDSSLDTSHRRPERRDSPCGRTSAPGGRHRCDGAPSGRDRLRQRSVRVADS